MNKDTHHEQEKSTWSHIVVEGKIPGPGYVHSLRVIGQKGPQAPQIMKVLPVLSVNVKTRQLVPTFEGVECIDYRIWGNQVGTELEIPLPAGCFTLC